MQRVQLPANAQTKIGFITHVFQDQNIILTLILQLTHFQTYLRIIKEDDINDFKQECHVYREISMKKKLISPFPLSSPLFPLDSSYL